jgi:predicted MFS family arabinose efflux permease
VGASTGAVAVPLAAIVSNRWFVKRRGLVTGLLTASNASGQLVFLPLLAWIVTVYGWRAAAATVALTAVLVVVPLALVFLRSDPGDVDLLPYGATTAEPPRAMINPFRNAIDTLRDIVHVRDFWLLAGAFFICGATTNGLIGTHLIAACSDHGLSAVRGAGLLAAIGVFDVVGTVCSGFLTDRYDPRWLLFWYYGLRGLSLLGLNAALGDAGLGLLAFIVFYGLDWVATVPPTVALCREVFGRERVGVVFAWVFACHQFGAAFAAWGAGASRTWLGSYQPAFLLAGALGVLAAMLSVSVGRRGLLRPVMSNA